MFEAAIKGIVAKAAETSSLAVICHSMHGMAESILPKSQKILRLNYRFPELATAAERFSRCAAGGM
jgi:hypothetical protein